MVEGERSIPPLSATPLGGVNNSMTTYKQGLKGSRDMNRRHKKQMTILVATAITWIAIVVLLVETFG